jgi:hypothetical protein
VQETLEALPYTDLNAFQLRPQRFREYLEKHLGFELVAERAVDVAAKGFDRPLLVFRKPELQTKSATGKQSGQ